MCYEMLKALDQGLWLSFSWCLNIVGYFKFAEHDLLLFLESPSFTVLSLQEWLQGDLVLPETVRIERDLDVTVIPRISLNSETTRIQPLNFQFRRIKNIPIRKSSNLFLKCNVMDLDIFTHIKWTVFHNYELCELEKLATVKKQE